jgi:hypothetical protein
MVLTAALSLDGIRRNEKDLSKESRNHGYKAQANK